MRADDEPPPRRRWSPPTRASWSDSWRSVAAARRAQRSTIRDRRRSPQIAELEENRKPWIPTARQSLSAENVVRNVDRRSMTGFSIPAPMSEFAAKCQNATPSPLTSASAARRNASHVAMSFRSVSRKRNPRCAARHPQLLEAPERQVVDAHDALAHRQEPIAELVANEAGRTRNDAYLGARPHRRRRRTGRVRGGRDARRAMTDPIMPRAVRDGAAGDVRGKARRRAYSARRSRRLPNVGGVRYLGAGARVPHRACWPILSTCCCRI